MVTVFGTFVLLVGLQAITQLGGFFMLEPALTTAAAAKILIAAPDPTQLTTLFGIALIFKVFLESIEFEIEFEKSKSSLFSSKKEWRVKSVKCAWKSPPLPLSFG